MAARKRAERVEGKIPLTASFVSLGCFKNIVDTEVLGGLLEQRGVKIVSAYEPADWLIINTCGFIHDAKNESIDEILSALEKKKKEEVAHVAVFGCLTQRYQADLQGAFGDLDILWGVNGIEELAECIAASRPAPYEDEGLFLYSDRHRRILTTTPNSTFIKISEGCDMACSFCTIPRIRGPFRSRPLASILREAEAYRGRGFTEINLISQNSTHYGIDRGSGERLPELLGEISRLGFSWVRVLYLMPEETDDRIIESFSAPSIVPYFDLPFQHVAPAVLKGMNRGGGRRKALELIRKVRGRFSGAVVRSSFIVGFPGERETDFAELLGFVEEARIEHVGVFAYSDEEETPAFLLPKKRAAAVISERRERLQSVADRNRRHHYRGMRGSIQDFLPLGPWDNQTTIGRIRSQAPEVDGLTRVKERFDQKYRVYPIRVTGFAQEILLGEKAASG